ncbi:N(4)-(beta-N-acetylglucosaminyl)-L-asparaginase [soil metagenome]
MPEPLLIATWPFGRTAAVVGGAALAAGASPLDAALAGATAVEDDPTVRSVGIGALANRIGNVSRDASVMCGRTLNCGAVAGLENIRHAAAVAKKVMNETPHLMLVGDGALWFALQQGFKMETHHTPESVKEWYDRHPGNTARPAGDFDDQPFHTSDNIGLPIDEHNHDTVTVLARDGKGHLGGVCSTSGLAYKLPGRVGDSPIIGAGLYADDEAGVAGGTGVGEEILRAGGSLFIVEQMRAGKSAQEAVELGVRRCNSIARRRGRRADCLAFIAIDKQGRTGAAASPGTNFEYALWRAGNVTLTRAVEIAE